MVTGTVTVEARISGDHLVFPRFEYSFGPPPLSNIEIEATGESIIVVGHVKLAASVWEATELVRTIANIAFDRIAFTERIVIHRAEASGHILKTTSVVNGIEISGGDVLMVAEEIQLTKELEAPAVKLLLEAGQAPHEHHLSLFREAIQSRSPVEEFMHLYTLLLTLYDDNQKDVDAFIISEQPGVQESVQTPKLGQKKPPRMETVYTRLRNELAHRRAGVDMTATKNAASGHVGALRGLVKRAIVLKP